MHVDSLKTPGDFVRAYTAEAREILEETYRFAANGKKALDNINAVLSLLDDIDAAVK